MKKWIFTIVSVLCATSPFSQNSILTKEQFQEDVIVLKASLELLHPGLNKFNSKQETQLHFDKLQNTITDATKLKDFYLAVAEFAATIKCGHTFLNPLNLDEAVSEKLFSKYSIPFYFKIVNDKMIITHNLSTNPDIKRGDEIQKIDGLSAQKIIAQLLKVSRSDGNNAIGKKKNNISVIPEEDYAHSLFDIFYPLYFGDKLTHQYEVKSLNGKLIKPILNSISVVDKKSNFETKFGKIKTDDATWVMKNINQQTTLLKFGTFSFWNSDFNYKKYLDSVFTAIQDNKNCKNLVIDLRGNEGGSGDIRNEILSYLTSAPISGEKNSKNCYSFLSIPDSIKKNLSTWDSSYANPKNATDFKLNELGLHERIKEGDVDVIQPNAKYFKGNIYLLTDAANSSATFDFAWTFQYNKLGTIVGENTAGTKRGLTGGEMFFLTLPNSRIEIDVPILYYYGKGMLDEGITPEYIVPITQSSIATDKDVVVDFIVSKITIK